MATAHRMSAVRQDPLASNDDVARLRVPPHSREAEQAILGALLQSAEAWPMVRSTVTEASFYVFEHRTIFGAIAALLTDGKPCDVVTAFVALRDAGQADDCGGLAYLNDLATCVASFSGAKRWAEIVAEKAALRAAIAAADAIATAGFNPQGRSAAEILADAQRAFKGIARAPSQGGLPMLSFDELRAASQAVTWTVKHVLPSDAIGLLFGASGTFKTYLALDAAMHVAHGLPWLGRRTKQGPALFIAAEGGTGLAGRLEAWHRQHRLKPPGPDMLRVIPVAVDLTVDAWKVAEKVEDAGIVPAIVVIDTFSQTFSGEENSANEVAAYFREIGNHLRALWKCTVLVLHHSGHNATERPRGSTAMQANTSFLLGAFRDEKEMQATLTCVHMKDGRTFDDVNFYLTSVGLGVDSDGDQVTQLAAAHIRDGAEAVDIVRHEAQRGRGGRNALLLDLLQSMDGQTEKDVKTAFFARCDIDNDATRRQAWKRAVDWMTRNGVAAFDRGTLRVLRKLD